MSLIFLVSCFYSKRYFKVIKFFWDCRGYFLTSWFFFFLLFWIFACVYRFILIYIFFIMFFMIISIFYSSGAEYTFDCSKATLIICFIFILFCIKLNFRSSLLFVQLFAMIFRSFRSILNILILILVLLTSFISRIILSYGLGGLKTFLTFSIFSLRNFWQTSLWVLAPCSVRCSIFSLSFLNLLISFSSNKDILFTLIAVKSSAEILSLLILYPF